MTCTCREGEICPRCTQPDMDQWPEEVSDAKAWLLWIVLALLWGMRG